MKFEDYTKDQQKAIIETGNIIVSAGAGSGKTQVLTERVIHFVNNIEDDKKLKLSEFLILTFTNLAASEMKNRIRKALVAVKSPEANEVDFSDICTFDSFAYSLVKRYHFKLGLSDKVSIIDTGIISVRKRTILEEILEEYYEKKEEVFKNMINRFCDKDDSNITNLILKFYDKSQLEIDTDEYLNTFIETYYNDEQLDMYFNKITQELYDRLNSLIESIDELDGITTTIEDVEVLYKDAILEELDKLLTSKTYEDIINNTPESINTPSPKGLTSKKVDENQANINKEIKDTIDKFKGKFNKFKDIIEKMPKTKQEIIDDFIEISDYVKLMIEIIRKLDKKIKEYKNNYQVFEFQDIAKMALNLVKTNDDVRESLKNQYKMIMIDEYQDTSLLQETFINEIANNNVYMVGDIKQSIYRFRNARSDIFKDKYDTFSDPTFNEGNAINLNANFRSRKEVLDDINYIFKNIMTDEYGSANYHKDHLIEYGNKAYLKAGKTGVSHNSDFLFVPKTSYNKTPEEEARAIAIDIITKINSKYQVYDKDSKTPSLRDCKFSDFCILMDRGTYFDIYAKVFNEYKIPLYIENDEDISNNEIVMLLTNLLRLMKHIQNYDFSSAEFKKYFISIARSFIYEYSDEQLFNLAMSENYRNDEIIINLKKIMDNSSHLSSYLLLKNVILELDIYHKCIKLGDIEKKEKYIDVFLDMFKSMSEIDYTLDDFIIYMENISNYNLKITLSSVGTELDSVRIMNVHKSKGLEFNIVYFSGLYKKFNRLDLENELGISEIYGVYMTPKFPMHIVKDLNTLYENIQDTSEKIRLFYVALTRTREKMIFVSSDDIYYSIVDKKNYDICMNYINNFKSTPNNILEMLYNDFLEGKICDSILYTLIKYFNIDLPYEFFCMSFEDKKNLSYDKLVSLIDINYINKIKSLASDIDNEDVYEAVKEIFSLYESSSITAKEMEHLGFELKIIINEEIYNLIMKKCRNDIENDQDNEEDFECDIDKGIESYVKGINYKLIDEYKPNLYFKYRNIVKKLPYINHDIGDWIIEVLNLEFNPSYWSILAKSKGDQKLASLELLNAIQYPQYIYDPKEARLEVNNIVRQAYFNDEINDEYIFDLLFLTQDNYNHFIRLAFNLLRLYRENKITKYVFDKLFDDIGYKFNTHLNLERMLDEDDNQTPIYEIFTPTDKHFEILNIIDDLSNLWLAKILYLYFKNEIISEDIFIILLDSINCEYTVHFAILDNESKKHLDSDNIDDIVTIKVHDDAKIDSPRETFKSFIYPFIDCHKFNFSAYNLYLDYNLNSPLEALKHNKLQIVNIPITNNKLEIKRASKELNLDASNKNLEFGTMIHSIMEITDFKNPNYEFIGNAFYSSVVKRFLSSDIVKSIKDATIYKEYEFYDEVNKTNGIIDLMLIYPNHIDIIDYKTKYIDDDAYLEQLKVYEDFAKKTFNKKVNTYLYSLLDGTYKRCS